MGTLAIAPSDEAAIALAEERPGPRSRRGLTEGTFRRRLLLR